MALLKSEVEATPGLIEILSVLASKRTAPRWLHERAGIILKTLSGLSVAETVKEVGSTTGKVNAWRRKWRSRQAWLIGREKELGESKPKLLEAVLEVLCDGRRSGKPPKFTEEQRLKIVALACGTPADHGIPETAWTNASLAREAESKGFVDSISASQVWRTLKKYGAEPAAKQVLDAPPNS